jgi:cell wall-associated NlpC family hydrolase
MAAADKFVGLPFKRGGRGPVHVDCWGLVKLYLEEMHAVSGLLNYTGTDDVSEAIRDAMALDTWVHVDAPRAGDVLVMASPVGGGAVAPLHVGVMVSATHVLNIDEFETSRCLPLNHPVIALRRVGFYRHRDLL